MHTLSPRQYLIQIQLKNLQCQPSTQIQKIFCQLHYGQKYIKFKTHPQINSNGVANFKKQIICIPYQTDIALVVKKNNSSKKQIFLGHYTIDVQQYLKKRIYLIELNQKLHETENYIHFNLKLINKHDLAESETEDLSEQEKSDVQKSQYSTLDQEDQFHIVNRRKLSIRTSQSQVNYNINTKFQSRSSPRNQSPFSNKKNSILTISSGYQYFLPQQLNKKLYTVDEIIRKKNLLLNQYQKLSNYRRNSNGQLKSQKIDKLEQILKVKKQQMVFNSIILYIVIGLVGFFIGFILVK